MLIVDGERPHTASTSRLRKCIDEYYCTITKLRISINTYPRTSTEEDDEVTNQHPDTLTEEDGDVTPIRRCGSMIRIISELINQAKKLTEYDLEEEDWKRLLSELNSRIKSEPEKVKEDITRMYGVEKRNALMSILVCHPPLEVIKFLVEKGGNNTVTESGGCGFNSIHYACWGNTSLDVISYLLDIGGKEALLTRSRYGGANPLHVACIRYTSTESNSLSDLFRVLIKVGGQDVVTATDFHNEIPFQGLLLRQEPPVDSIVTFLDEWYKLKNPGEALISNGAEVRHSFNPGSEEGEEFKDDEEGNTSREAPREALNKVIRQLSKTHGDAQSQILTSQFMKEYLTERFIEPLSLAILMIDLYIQIMIVCVFSFFINPNSPNPVNSTIINIILIICIIWRLTREIMQGMATPFGAYFGDISNWFDIAQIVLIFQTLRTNLDTYTSSSSYDLLIFATFFSWFELLLELHNFQYDLALFVVALIKIMKRLRSFIFTTFMFIIAFAHAYYIAGPDDTELCNNEANYTKEAFDLAGGFTCTRSNAYAYSFSSLLVFEIPSGVPQWIPLLYAIVTLILLLNIIIAVVCTEFEDVLNESELTFWSDRLVIVNELGAFCSGHSTSPLFLRSIFLKVQKWCNSWDEELSSRMDLNLFLENSVWDGMNEKEQGFLHWWYGKSKEKDKPNLGTRLNFFIWNSALKDIFIPGSVFENLLLGYKRSKKPKRMERIVVIPFSIILMVGSSALFAIVFMSGFLTLGIFWPEIMKKRLFAVNDKKRGIIRDTKKNNEETSAIRKDISMMMVENNGMMNKINEMTKNNEVVSPTREDIVEIMKAENNAMRKEIREMRKEIGNNDTRKEIENNNMRKEISEMKNENNGMRKDIQEILSGINSLTEGFTT